MKFFKFITFVIITTQSFALNVIVPKAPPAIPAIKAAKELENVKVHYFTDPVTQVVPKIMQNKEFVYAIPTNLAAKLKNKGKDLQLLGITTNGLLSIISSENFADLTALEGKDIYVGGQGSSPDVITQYILKENKVKANMKYRSSAEVAKLIMTNKIKYAVLPEPLATLALFKNKKLNRAIIYRDEWAKVNKGYGLPQVGFFASKKFIYNNEAEIKEFLNKYKQAVIWVNNNAADAAKLGKGALMLPMPEKVIENSITNMNLIYLDIKESRESVKLYLGKLIDVNKKILSKLPKDDFYEK